MHTSKASFISKREEPSDFVIVANALETLIEGDSDDIPRVAIDRVHVVAHGAGIEGLPCDDIVEVCRRAIGGANDVKSAAEEGGAIGNGHKVRHESAERTRVDKPDQEGVAPRRHCASQICINHK